MPTPLEPWEMAYFDTIRDRNQKVTLVRMELDGVEVAAACQEVKGTTIGGATALMPLAVMLNDDMVKRMTMGDQKPTPHDAKDFIAETRDEP